MWNNGVIYEMPFDESACNVDQASMSIDMIGPFCASSSRIKTTLSFQILLWLR